MNNDINYNYFIVRIKTILNIIFNGEELGYREFNLKYTVVRQIDEDFYIDYFTKKEYRVGVKDGDESATSFIDPSFDFICLNEFLKNKSRKEKREFLGYLKMYLAPLLVINSDVKRETIIETIREKDKIKVKKRGSINEENI